MAGILGKIFNKVPKITIDSQTAMEEAISTYGVMPFFHNPVKGFSIVEITEPGMLFGGNEGYDGCWEWKGPVIRERNSAYGKFFRRKAGFITLDLLPDFINYRRNKYPVKPDSTEEMLLDIISLYDGITSTELRKLINGSLSDELPDMEAPSAKRGKGNPGAKKKSKRSSLEGPLQRLQMGGRLLISDFEYKLTKKGERYGWGVAVYSTPEIWLGNNMHTDRTPEESFEFLVKNISSRIPWGTKKSVAKLLE